MSHWTKIPGLSFLALYALATPLPAQEPVLDPGSSVKIELPIDSPLTLVSPPNMGDSRASTRGSAIELNLHMSLTLRNVGYRRVRGVTLLITAQEFAAGGKGSVARPCIDVAPNQEFTIPVDIRLVRPVQQTAGPLVRVQLDGVLFDDLSFFGPDRLNSKRAMTFWETEAQRDRTYFKQILSAKGDKALGTEMRASMARQAERPQLDVSISRTGRTVGSVVTPNDHIAQFAFLRMPGAPVQAVEGTALIAGNEARAPQIEVMNQSNRPVRYVEIGWLMKDREGRQYMAGTVPGSSSAMLILPGQHNKLTPDTTLKFSRTGHPVEIQGMTGFVSEVEFADGKVWVPSREEIQASPLFRIIPASSEEQRLADIYSTRGLAALVAELNKY